MKKTYFFCLIIWFLCSCESATVDMPVSTDSGASEQETTRIVPNTKVVRFSSENADLIEENSEIKRLFPKAGEFEKRHREAGLHRWYIISCDSETKAADVLGNLPEPEVVEDFRKLEFCSGGIPFNDPNSYKQWHLFNDGSLMSGFKKGADINVVNVWSNFTGGSRDVIVAVIDSGVDATHPDLAGITVPDGENGSRNFIHDYSSTPFKTYPERHGTHVGGIIGAINNNAYGCCGVAGGTDGNGGVRILSCQALSEKHSGSVSEALVWAADHGAVIANNSWNLSYDNESDVPDETPEYIRNAIDYFIKYAGFDSSGKQSGPMAGGLVLFSAGNKEWCRMQPSMYEKVLAVGACGPAYESSGYSNYGNWVDICAPGGDYSSFGSYTATIYSCIPGPGFAQMQGTSQACPVVSGVAALILSQFGGEGFTPDLLKEILLGGANYDAEKYHSRKIGPMVDAYESFMYMAGPLPDVTDFTVLAGETSLVFKWSVQKFGGLPVHSYTCYASTRREDIENLDPENVPKSVLSTTTNTSGKAIGSTVSRPLYHITPGMTYYCTILGHTKSGKYSSAVSIKGIKTGTNHAPKLDPASAGPLTVRYKKDTVVKFQASDADGDKLSFETSPGSTAGTWTVTEDDLITLKINGRGAPAGNYIATATVRDPVGDSVAVKVNYTLIPNHAPTVVKTIEAFSVSPTLDGIAFRLDEYFKDEDDDELSYLVQSSDNAVIARESGKVMIVQGNGTGEASVNITANDPFGLSAQMEFRVLSQESEISVYPNPVHNMLYIRTLTQKNIDISVISAIGGELFRTSSVAKPFEPAVIDVSTLAAGTYSLKLISDGKETQTTIVKL